MSISFVALLTIYKKNKHEIKTPRDAWAAATNALDNNIYFYGHHNGYQ